MRRICPPPAALCTILAVEALPGQYDQRADSAQQCIQLLTGGERPRVACAKVYVLMGELTEGDLKRIKGYLINPVECREASMDKPATLAQDYPMPPAVKTIGRLHRHVDETALNAMLGEYGLAMDLNDLKFMQAYFRDEEKRDPTVSRACGWWTPTGPTTAAHTTFGTHIGQRRDPGQLRWPRPIRSTWPPARRSTAPRRPPSGPRP